jgi:hypothetical protein
VGRDGDLLVMAAWLHDIGYAPELQRSSFHPLDGAWYLRKVGASLRLCGLVANHSGAAVEARLRDVASDLAEFPDERSLARDALWCCDMTTSPVGEPVSFSVRLEEIRERYGADHTVPRAIAAAADEIRAAIDRVDRAAQLAANQG